MLDQLHAADIAIIFIAIVLSISFHEAMHGFAAHWLGDSTAKEQGRLTLNPLKHIDIYLTVLLPLVLILLRVPPFLVAKPVPFNPNRVKWGEYGAALLALAGPFTNLLLAAAGAGIMRLTGVAVGTSAFNILDIFVIINLGLFVFNMIPIPPLDGSRLLYAFAPEPLQEIMYRIESMGFITIIIFMFLLFPVISPVVGNVVQGLYNILLG